MGLPSVATTGVLGKILEGVVYEGPDIPLAHQREEVCVAVLQARPVGAAVGRRHRGFVTITMSHV